MITQIGCCNAKVPYGPSDLVRGVLLIVEIPCAVYSQITQDAGFGIDGDVEGTIQSNRSNVDG